MSNEELYRGWIKSSGEKLDKLKALGRSALEGAISKRDQIGDAVDSTKKTLTAVGDTVKGVKEIANNEAVQDATGGVADFTKDIASDALGLNEPAPAPPVLETPAVETPKTKTKALNEWLKKHDFRRKKK